MLSNNTTNKLKALKSSREYREEKVEDDNSTENTINHFGTRAYSEGNENDKEVGNHSRVMVFAPRTRTRGLLEFCPGHGDAGDRRGPGGRGKSTYSSRREYSDIRGHTIGRKFQEPLNKTNETVNSSHHYRRYDDKNRYEGYGNLPEDPRISKMLRKLCIETDQDKSIAICHKLLDTLMLPDNAKYIRRAFDILTDSLLDVMTYGPCDETKGLASRALGRIGYVMESDFKFFVTWLVKEFTRNRDDEIKILLMKSLIETYTLEQASSKLFEFCTFALNQIINQLEYADRPEIFMILIDVVLAITECYPEVSTHFRDVVDILVGWLIESNHSPEMADYASRSLSRLGNHWQTNISFSIQLLAQFLEDLVSFGEALTHSSSGSSTPLGYISPRIETSLNQVTALTRVINTILKCLGHCLNPTNSPCITLQFLTDCFVNIVSTATKTLDKYLPENLIIAANESAYILLGYMQSKPAHANEFLYNLIDAELALTQDFNDATLVSMLLLITQTIKEVSANLPLNLVHKLLGPNSEILKMRSSSSIKVQSGVVSVYHSLLNLKNIPLLQEAYRYVLGDLEQCFSVLIPTVKDLCQNNPFSLVTYNKIEAEITTLFLLRCLSDLANASSSIIGMWALKPSILELLAVKLHPYDVKLGFYSPTLQFAILYLLYSHCKRYNHFVSSSSLVFDARTNVCEVLGLPLNLNLGEGATSSPTSGHLTIILDVLTKSLRIQMCSETKNLVLKWSKEIITLSDTYHETLQRKENFVSFIEAVVESGYSSHKEVIIPVYKTLYLLISKKNIKWSNEFLKSVTKLCALHLNSMDDNIRQMYTKLLVKVPWNIKIIELQKFYEMSEIKRKCNNHLFGYNMEAIILAQHLHTSRGTYGEMQTQSFKKFMSYLLFGNKYENNWLKNLFDCSWPLEPVECEDYVADFGNLATSSNILLLFWAAWESAQFCVNNKLRTALGKPIDTLTNIEIAIKKLAREVGSLNDKSERNLQQNDGLHIEEFKRVRLLLDFMEHFEKVIYNASEGCAVAMLQPDKPVRIFFHTNASTCREWLSRIRVAIIVVALHTGQSAMALRCAQALLQDLCKANNTQGAEFERALMYAAWALLNLNETEAIQGLYVWANDISTRKFSWLKAVAEQACHKYENAAASYEEIIETEVHNKEVIEAESEPEKIKLNNEIDKQLISFMSDQIIECYRNINDWKNLLKWKEHETELLNVMNQNGGTSLYYTVNNISAEYSRILSEFEETDYICTNDLSKWDFELELKKNKNSWSIYNLFENVESNLFNIALKFTKSTDFNLKNIVDECILTIETNICENLCVFPKDLTCNLILFNHIGCSLRNVISKNSTNFDMDDAFEVHTNSENIRKLDLKTLSKVLHWCEYFTSLKCVRGETYLPNLRLEIARIARKEGNFSLARRQIQKYFDLKKELYLASETNGNQWGILENISKSVIECNNLDITIWTYNNVKAIMEAAKLIHTSHDNKEIALNLCAVASLGVSQRLTISDNYDLCEKGTRMLLTLAKWIQTESNASILNEISSPVGHLITILPEIGLVESIGTDVIPLQDMAVGKLYQFATNQCPSLAKVWFNFGSWCYRWGRKMVDHSSETGGQLSESDRFAIQSLLPLGSSVDDLQNVYQILSQTRAMTDDEDIESNEINTSEMIEAQLRSVPVLSNVHPDRLSLLVEIWRTAQKRIYSYYELSANSYFKYLQLYNNSETAGVDDCKTITTTLRLLRLIVKHALELQTVLEAGLATTPTQPWKVIIPQLFSRLNHPEGYVRRRVSELLCRVAEDAPHLITFPAVVGAAQGRNKVEFTEITLTKDYLSQQIDEVENDDSEKDTTKVLDSCFMSMVETLSKQAPETITQVQLLVKELRRITLLRDELWLGTLLQHNSEIVKRLSQLEHEILKVNNNVNLAKDEKSRLITEKHRIMMKPVIFILEQLNAITSNEPETPNEKLFQERFDILIKESIEKLKNPVNPEKPKESLQALKILQNRLQQRAHKRSSYTLKMSEISPVLANMRDTVITMPGLASTSKKLVTILSVDEHVSILPTKTKPKKLIFRGSDGQNYTYLFKGLEDLHLDERIMQFLSIANTMLARSTEISNRNVYRARHYSVIPLGPRSGLISWVDGTTPLFALYKRWQQREAMKACLRQTNSDQNTVLRPSELFYNKLHPLLKEHGVKNPDNRKEWPVAVLKQVLTELMAETPDDLLARELWCHSVDASGWWQTIRSYSHSVAVMSIIGYIIGLGDRHLDNVLVDLASGEVVHIDYNVCFEKGKTLRVPEKVPFRMTPNMRVALGITGVEGIFRLACEHVLKTMKKGRETILTLLEAFVYDPLVDWTMNADSSALVGSTTTAGGNNSTAGITAGGQTRRELEREVTAAMFNVRCAEMRAEWLSNRDDILKQTPVVVQHLTKWLDEESNIKVSEETLHDLHQQMALIKEAEAHASSGKHTLFSLPTRYEAYKRTYDTFKAAKKTLEEKIDDCERRIASHNNALNTIRGPQLGQWIQELNFPIDNESHAVFDPVKEFLQNAGQSSMILQCEQCEKELGQLAQQQSLYIRSCLDLLNQYSAVASNYPSTYVEKHRTVCYLKWCKILLETKSVGVCLDVLSQFESFFAPENVNSPIAQQVVSFSYQLQTVLNEANLKLKKSYDRLTAEGIPEVGCRLDKAYNEAKTNIASFLRNEKGSTKALECVNITALCALNKRYLMMEQAAASAGDCLVDLHSMDGDWFLDEMHLMSSLVTELSGMIPTHHNSATKVDDSRVPVILNCLRTANNVYMGLQELNFNFHTIILPEAMKTIQTEDVTVITMINELNEIILNVGCRLPKILEQLELHLRFTIMEMDSPHAGVQSIVTQLRTQYESLLHSHTEQSSDLLTPGKMLLMGFNGLFDKLSVESNLLISSLNSLDTPICWKKVDQFREAKALSAPVFNEHTRSVLDDIFLIKRIQTMTEFFSLCTQTAVGFKGISIATVFDDVQLDKPIRRFTADYVSRRLLGVTSQTIALALCLLLQRMGLNVTNEIEQRDIGAENKVPLEELCKKIVDIHLKRGAFTSNVLAQASSLSSSLENAWRRREIAKYLQQIIEAQRSTLQRIQLQLTAHHWLHEDIIMLQPGLTSTSPLVRSNFMMELRKTSSSLISMQNRLTEAREQQRSLILSVEQRLKWAAGANPALNDVLAAFECAVNIREDRLTVEQNLAQQVGNTCNVLLNHEALRTRTSEGLSHDSSFVACVNQWRQACLLLSQCNTTITQTEESLMQLLPTENLIDINWIQNATTLISNLIGTHQQDTLLRNEAMALIKNNLQAELSKFKEYWKIHHHLMGDIRNLLKSMSKSDECAVTGIQDYLQKYYLYSETITSAFQLLNCEDIEENDIKKTLVDLANVEPLTNEIYEDLFKLEVNQNNSNGQISKGKRPPLVRQETVWQSPYKTIANRGQQRNAYAVGVWRRVRMKLEGRDPDPGRKYSLQEQVDYVIREATNIENLALLYEGWTPWV